MSTSVVRVEQRVHSKLREISNREHRPIGQIVAELVDKYEREEFWRKMHEGFSELRQDPEAWEAYQDEVALWDSTLSDGVLKTRSRITHRGRRPRSMPSTLDPKAGEIRDVVQSPGVGYEQGGHRPALVVSNDDYNTTPHGLRLVVPIAGTIRDIPSQIVVQPPEGGLTKPSVFLCEQVRAVSVLRFRIDEGAWRAPRL